MVSSFCLKHSTLCRSVFRKQYFTNLMCVVAINMCRVVIPSYWLIYKMVSYGCLVFIVTKQCVYTVISFGFCMVLITVLENYMMPLLQYQNDGTWLFSNMAHGDILMQRSTCKVTFICCIQLSVCCSSVSQIQWTKWAKMCCCECVRNQ